MTAPQQQRPEAVRVKVVDVDISMGQMIILLVKLVLAAIPAAILAAVIMLVPLAFISGAGMFSQLFR